LVEKITWSINAKEDLRSVLKYLQQNWPPATLRDFMQKLADKLSTIQQFPELGRTYSDSKSIRSLVLIKQISIYYLYNKKQITVLGLFDTRKDPDKKKF
jgi:plasmid stabilization system protein ParE